MSKTDELGLCHWWLDTESAYKLKRLIDPLTRPTKALATINAEQLGNDVAPGTQPRLAIKC